MNKNLKVLDVVKLSLCKHIPAHVVLNPGGQFHALPFRDKEAAAQEVELPASGS